VGLTFLDHPVHFQAVTLLASTMFTFNTTETKILHKDEIPD